jgi:hypothetical protein
MRGSVHTRTRARTLAKRAPGIYEVEPIARPRLYKIAHFEISRLIRPEFTAAHYRSFRRVHRCPIWTSAATNATRKTRW